MKIWQVLFFFSVSSRAGMMAKPLSQEIRTTEFNLNSTKIKSDNYQIAKFWLPTVLKSNSQLIQAEDKETGMISGTAYIPCSDLPGSLIVRQSIEFQYLIKASEKTVNIKFFNQRIYSSESNYGTKDTNIYNDESQVPAVKVCLTSLSKELEDRLK